MTPYGPVHLMLSCSFHEILSRVCKSGVETWRATLGHFTPRVISRSSLSLWRASFESLANDARGSD